MSPFLGLVAATTQQRIGFFVAVFMIVGWLAYLFVTLRQRDTSAPPGSEVELAPNRKPYYTDEEMEGPRLERALGWALVLLAICSIGPLAYWLNEPSRQAGAIETFDEASIHRGESLALPTDSPEHGAHFGCQTCHGTKGEGGAVPNYTISDYLGRSRQVTWSAPALDTAALKFDREEIRTILVYGRANSPMPAWGVEGGGPMNDQQIDDLVNWIQSIQLTPEKAKEVSTKSAQDEAGRGGGAAGSGDVLFRANCARCHTQGWSYGEPGVMGGGAAFGPNLTGGVTLRQFPDVEEMIDFIAEGSEYAQPYGVAGVGDDAGGGMPGFGQVLTPEQIRAIVEYERTL